MSLTTEGIDFTNINLASLIEKSSQNIGIMVEMEGVVETIHIRGD